MSRSLPYFLLIQIIIIIIKKTIDDNVSQNILIRMKNPIEMLRVLDILLRILI